MVGWSHRQAVFVRTGNLSPRRRAPGRSWLRAEAGSPLVDGTGLTSVPGVWAAGNVADPRAQVITSAGAGSAAATAIDADLVEEDADWAVASFAEPAHYPRVDDRARSAGHR